MLKIILNGSGRDQFLKSNSGDETKASAQAMKPEDNPKYSKPDDALLQKQLTAIRYKVTQQDATEPSFNNEYHDNKADGIYVDTDSLSYRGAPKNNQRPPAESWGYGNGPWKRPGLNSAGGCWLVKRILASGKFHSEF